MILATYQPLEERDKKENNYKELEQMLGYRPIFCFSAETLQDVLIGSALAYPNCPERLIIFETDEYQEINMTLWNKRKTEIEQGFPTTVELKDIFNPEGKCKEYIVKDIPKEDICADIDLLQTKTIPFEYHQRADASTRDFLDEFVKTRREEIKMMLMHNSVFIPDSITWDKMNDEHKILFKEIWQLELLPFLYMCVFKIRDFQEIVVVDMEKYEPWLMRKEAFCKPDLNLQFKNEKFGDELYNGLMRVFGMTVKKRMFLDQVKEKNIYPNDPCPCGSGLKYKKCCMRKYED